MSPTNLDISEIDEVAKKISKKFLIQIEGATCSGKTTLINDYHSILLERGLEAFVIEDCATNIFKSEPELFIQLDKSLPFSSEWKTAKKSLQEKVLLKQINCLKQFSADKNYSIALMDRGGSSTAFHTIPWLDIAERQHILQICFRIAGMSKLILFLPTLGFLSRDTLRYQKKMEEIVAEQEGIKGFLHEWKLVYIEIKELERVSRVKTADRLISPQLLSC